MKSWHVAIAVALACLLLGYRVLAAERRVDRLQARLGPQTEGATSGDSQARLAELDADVARLADRLARLAQHADTKPNAEEIAEGVSQERILSVVTAEQRRQLERQVEFHRDRWIEQRETALSEFAQRFGLSRLDHERIRAWLVSEIDELAKLLKSQQERPELLVSGAARLLIETDRRVEPLLGSEALAFWRNARYAERRMLWPWLPEPLSP